MLLRHTFFYLMSRLVTVGTAFFSVWLFSRLLAPAEFGFYSTVMAAATIINLGLFQWLRITLMRFLPASAAPGALQEAALWLFMLLSASLLVLVPLTFLVPRGTWQYLVPSVLLVTWALAASELSLGQLRTRLLPLHFLAFSAIRDILQVGLVLLFLPLGWRAEGLVAAAVIANLLPVLLWFPLAWKGGCRPRYDRELVRKFYAYGLPLIGLYAVGALLANADRILLPLLVSSEAAGLYGAASSLARQTLTALLQVINLAAFPLAIAAYKHNDPAAARHHFERSFILLLGVGLPAAAGLAVLARPIAQLVLGADYVEAATHMMPWLALAALLQGLRTYYTDQAFLLVGETRKCMNNLLLTGALTLPLSAALIYWQGLPGAVYGMTLGFALSLALGWFGQTTFRLPLPQRETGWIVIATLLMVLTLWPLRQVSGAVPVLAAIGAGGLVYMAVMMVGDVLHIRSHSLSYLRERRAA